MSPIRHFRSFFLFPTSFPMDKKEIIQKYTAEFKKYRNIEKLLDKFYEECRKKFKQDIIKLIENKETKKR